MSLSFLIDPVTHFRPLGQKSGGKNSWFHGRIKETTISFRDVLTFKYQHQSSKYKVLTSKVSSLSPNWLFIFIRSCDLMSKSCSTWASFFTIFIFSISWYSNCLFKCFNSSSLCSKCRLSESIWSTATLEKIELQFVIRAF